MQNLENLDVFEILIAQKLLKCPKDPFVRSALICIFAVIFLSEINLLNRSSSVVVASYKVLFHPLKAYIL